MLKKLGLITASAVSVLGMHSAEINVNDVDLEFNAKFDMGQFNHDIEPNTVFLGAKYLNAEAEHSDVPKIYDYSELSFLSQKEISDDVTLGLGVKLNYTKDFVTVPLGIEAAFRLPTNPTIPLYLGASLYYASEALSMDEATGFLEYRVNLDIEVIENACIRVGYRSLDTYYKTMDIEYNKSTYVGFKFTF